MAEDQLSLDEILELAGKAEKWYPETDYESLDFGGHTDRRTHMGYYFHPRDGIMISIGKAYESYGHQPPYPTQNEYSIWCEQEHRAISMGMKGEARPHAYLGYYEDIFDLKGNVIKGTGKIRTLYEQLKAERDQKEEGMKLAQQKYEEAEREKAVRIVRGLIN